MGIKVLSLFDGISCGRVALEKLNLEVEVYDAYEIEEDAIKVSKHNYPDINHKGDVYKAEYSLNEYDLIIGGSPCTHWSIAKTSGRETTSSGIGYDLFMQYARAIKEVKPKYFLYENNNGINKKIVNAISEELGVQPIMINSKLVSGQSRKRLYWTNIPNINQPEDRNIKLTDIVDFSSKEFKPVGAWVWNNWAGYGKAKIHQLKTVKSEKSHTLTTSKTHSMGYYLNEEKTHYTNLSVNDFELLQTLPLNYVHAVNIKETSKYRAIGNGWTVDVISHILKNMEV